MERADIYAPGVTLSAGDFTVEQATPADAEAIKRVGYETTVATYPRQETSITEDVCRQWAFGSNPAEKASKLDQLRTRIQRAQQDPTSSPDMLYVARYGGHVVGYIACKKSTDPLVNEGMYPSQARGNATRHSVSSLYVLPRFHHARLGRRLLAHGLDWLGDPEDIAVRVAEYNDARALYRRIGFQEEGVDHDWEEEFGYHMPEVIAFLPRDRVPRAIDILTSPASLPHEQTPALDFSSLNDCPRRRGPLPSPPSTAQLWVPGQAARDRRPPFTDRPRGLGQ